MSSNLPPSTFGGSCQLCSACFTIPLVGPESYPLASDSRETHCDKNALISCTSRLLGEKIRIEEAVRPRTVVFLSSESRAASGKVKLCSQPTVTQEKNKTARDLRSDYFYTKQDFLAKFFQFLLYRRSSILQGIYFLYRIRRFCF